MAGCGGTVSGAQDFSGGDDLPKAVAMGYTADTTTHRVLLGLWCAFRRLGFGRTPDPTAALRGGRSCVYQGIFKALALTAGALARPREGAG